VNTLVIGTGFVGTAVALGLRDRGIEVVCTSRRDGAGDLTVANGAALDRVLGYRMFDQIVAVGQLTSHDIDWVLDRIDGPHWLVLSSHQVAAVASAPQTRAALAREDLALDRGACVLRPTMIYGKGRDKNLSRLIRLMARWRVPVVPGDGSQLIQPIHVDDLIELIVHHQKVPAAGLYPVGGAEALPLRELVATLAQVLGLRFPVVALPQRALHLAALFGPAMGIRNDQIRRLTEPKIVDLTRAIAAFGWRPTPLGIRLEQAVMEVGPINGVGPGPLGEAVRLSTIPLVGLPEPDVAVTSEVSQEEAPIT
jgi:nucleoside-diphosphate-sugar epimerase